MNKDPIALLNTSGIASTYLNPMAGAHYVLACVLFMVVLLSLLLLGKDHPQKPRVFQGAVLLLLICFPAYPYMQIYRSGFYNLMCLLYWALLIKVLFEWVESAWGKFFSTILVLLAAPVIAIMLPAKVIWLELQALRLELETQQTLKDVFVEAQHFGYQKCPIGLYIIHASPRGHLQKDYQHSQWLDAKDVAEFPKGSVATECSQQELANAKTSLVVRLLHPDFTSQQRGHKNGQWHDVKIVHSKQKPVINELLIQPVLFSESLRECRDKNRSTAHLQNQKPCSFLLFENQIKGLKAYLELLNNKAERDEKGQYFLKKFERLIDSNLQLSIGKKQQLQSQLQDEINTLKEQS